MTILHLIFAKNKRSMNECVRACDRDDVSSNEFLKTSFVPIEQTENCLMMMIYFYLIQSPNDHSHILLLIVCALSLIVYSMWTLSISHKFIFQQYRCIVLTDRYHFRIDHLCVCVCVWNVFFSENWMNLFR